VVTTARILFVTGKLAEPALRATLAAMRPDFEHDVAVLRITVAALMTTPWIARHLPPVEGVDRIVIPGLCEGDVGVIEARVGVPAVKGPADVRDLPEFFGQAVRGESYGAHDIRIFAEINNVPYREREEVFRLAEALRAEGADVIDLGCSLDRRFDDAAEVIGQLKARGFTLSVDTFDPDEILAADRAGVDYVLSLHGGNLEVAPALQATPVVIPDPGDGLASLDRSVARLKALGRPHILDPILPPIGLGFAQALDRYVEVRARYPETEMLMGIGNVTELTEADTTGVHAVLIGFCQELGIRNVLTTEVIDWARGAVREIDVARRLMYAAQQRGVPPKRIDDRLLTTRDGRPKYYTEPELLALHAAITDPNYRICTTRDAIYVFNNRLFVHDTEIQPLFDQLGVSDPAHAFYLGRELTKAKLALLLGKTYVQEQPLRWGYLTPAAEESRHGRVRLEAPAAPAGAGSGEGAPAS
jgi:dihydropteroate synthase